MTMEMIMTPGMRISLGAYNHNLWRATINVEGTVCYISDQSNGFRFVIDVVFRVWVDDCG